ncbi:DUF4291 family protein [Streptomyces sp. NPDC057950]|uniref:DUF4291 family protein n=1 Tax=Streptomyces sp. NPDC057950 TaxID=3346288 RepID=UPI0036E8C8D4
MVLLPRRPARPTRHHRPYRAPVRRLVAIAPALSPSKSCRGRDRTAASDAVADMARQSQEVRERGLAWIKPSFPWMTYRRGWAAKAGQEAVLAIGITRDGLRDRCLVPDRRARGGRLNSSRWTSRRH